MIFTTTEPRSTLQRRLDREAQPLSRCRWCSDDEAAQFTACPSETEEAVVADRPLFARPRPDDGGGSNLLQRRPSTGRD